ncbi:MAG: DUF362 domain-containing protein [bacterium]|nr:DUF362 domain-containing protein [bacterium]
MANVSKVEFKRNIKETVSEAISQIGGFGKFINVGDVVLLKPNFNTADPFPASTDFWFLKSVIELIYEAGAKIVLLGDSSTITANTRKVMEKLGVFELEKMETPPRIYVFEEGSFGLSETDIQKAPIKWIKKDIPSGEYLKSVSLPNLLDKIDKLILLPCLKTHKYAQFTGALKLSVGFVKPTDRLGLHFRNLQEKIAELNTIIRPALVIMDARKCFITEGPASGELREPNLIMASTSRVEIDVEGIKIIQSFKGNSLTGIDPWQLPQIKKAVELRIDNSQ